MDGPLRFGGGEVGVALVDIGRKDGDIHCGGLFDERQELLLIFHDVGHCRGDELDRVIGFEPGGLVGDECVGGGVGFIEAVAGELFEEVKNLVGPLFGYPVGGGAAIDELLAHFLHDLHVLFTHGAAHDIGFAQRETGQRLGGLHHLFLVDHDPVGLFADLFQERVEVFDFDLPVAPIDEVWDELHGARAVERHQRGDVLNGADLKAAAEIAHTAGFQLEYPDRFTAVEQCIGFGVILRNVVDIDGDLMVFLDELAGVVDNGEGSDAEHIHFEEAQVTHGAHRVLGDDDVVVILAQRQQVDERLGADDDPRRMGRGGAGDIFQCHPNIDYLARIIFGFISFLELFDHIDRFPEGGGFPFLQRDGCGEHLGEAVPCFIFQAQGTGNVADSVAGAQRAESGDLGHAVIPVLLADVVDDFSTAIIREIDINIGRVDALGVEEALKEQVKAERLDVGNLQ